MHSLSKRNNTGTQCQVSWSRWMFCEKPWLVYSCCYCGGGVQQYIRYCFCCCFVVLGGVGWGRGLHLLPRVRPYFPSGSRWWYVEVYRCLNSFPAPPPPTPPPPPPPPPPPCTTSQWHWSWPCRCQFSNGGSSGLLLLNQDVSYYYSSLHTRNE